MRDEQDQDTAIEPTIIEVVSGEHVTEVAVCPGCGRPEAEWQVDAEGVSGYAAPEGTTFCCAGCAEETGCTCSGEPH